MYKIDWEILWRESEDDRFTTNLKDLIDKNPGIQMIGVKRDYDDDIEYINLKDGRIIASDGSIPVIMNISDYDPDSGVVLVGMETNAFVLDPNYVHDDESYIYTADGKYRVIYNGKDNFFAVDEKGKECLIAKRDTIDGLSREFYLHLDSLSKEDAIRKLERIKNILIKK